jgi:hypothetical protein
MGGQCRQRAKEDEERNRMTMGPASRLWCQRSGRRRSSSPKIGDPLTRVWGSTRREQSGPIEDPGDSISGRPHPGSVTTTTTEVNALGSSCTVTAVAAPPKDPTRRCPGRASTHAGRGRLSDAALQAGDGRSSPSTSGRSFTTSNPSSTRAGIHAKAPARPARALTKTSTKCAPRR